MGRKSIIAVTASALSIIWAGAALAQDLPRTIQEAEVVPRFADGQLQGCAVNFEIAQRDDIYAAGAAVGLSGSFQVYNFGGTRVMAMLKVGYLDLDAGMYAAPSQAYLVNGFATSVGEAMDPMPSETPGFGLFGFRLGDQTTASVVSIMETGTLSFAYQREGGMTGVPVTIDIGGEPEKIAQWADCIDALLLSDAD